MTKSALIIDFRYINFECIKISNFKIRWSSCRRSFNNLRLDFECWSSKNSNFLIFYLWCLNDNTLKFKWGRIFHSKWRYTKLIFKINFELSPNWTVTYLLNTVGFERQLKLLHVVCRRWKLLYSCQRSVL